MMRAGGFLMGGNKKIHWPQEGTKYTEKHCREID